MKSAIDRDLRQTERRESHLWFLAFALLILFGTVIVGHYAVVLLNDAASGSGLSYGTAYRAAGGLFFLIALFCLYVLHTLILNRRIKSLLVEVNSVAASSLELDDFLPSIAHKIAKTCSVSTCQIALLTRAQTALKVRSAHGDGGTKWDPRVGKAFALDGLTVCERALETLQPVTLGELEIAQLPNDGATRELLTAGLHRLHSILVVPMVNRGQAMGLIILGRTRGLMRRRLTASVIVMAQSLARHVARAIDQSELNKEAIRDPLTNLYNRRHFTDRLREEIARAIRHEHLVVVLLCDLDRFKAVNDTRGHQIGDAVLKATASCIQQSTRGTDLVFRWGGDEIVVVLAECSREGALIVAGRIRDAVSNVALTTQVDLDVSIGIAMYPEHGRDEQQLIRIADRALYTAKTQGHKIHVGDEEQRLDEHSIKVVFQPVVDASSHQVFGYEALTRDPQGSLSVLELFEKYRAIGRLRELKQVTFNAQIKIARELGLERVFINADLDLLDQLDPLPMPPGMEVVVELSELEALRDAEPHLSVIRSWREAGYKFALDDFGAGLVSFPFLSKLVPDYVKVDRLAMLQAMSSDEFREFLASILGALKSYAGAGIIAEGIEQEQELELVREMGISLVQGFLFGKPCELDRPIRLDALRETREAPVGTPA